MDAKSPLDATGERGRRRLSGWKLYLLVFAAFMVLYGCTAQRGPAWQDSGIFQWRILQYDVRGRLGLALSHPMLIVLGKAFSFLPFGALAWRMNLPSAFAAALAAANIALLVRRLAPGSTIAACLAAAGFGLAHTTWWLATICESQTLLVAIFTLELHVLLSLVRRPRVNLVLLLGLLNGLALTAHNLALLALPAYGVVVVYLCVRGRLSRPSAPLFVLGWLFGASGFLALVLFEAGQVGIAAAVHSALFGLHWRGAVFGGSQKAVPVGLGFIIYNFPNFILPLAAVGLLSSRRALVGPLRWALLYMTGIYLLFAIRYAVPDQFMFFLPFYAMLAVWAGVGLGRLRSGRRRRWLAPIAAVGLALTCVIYALAPSAWRAFSLPLPGRDDLPYRDAARYWLCPWKGGENSAGLFARAALGRTPSGGTIIADGTSLQPLRWVQRREGLGKAVCLLLVGQATPQRVPVGLADIFVVSKLPGYHPAWMTAGERPHALLRKDGPRSVLFRVVWQETFTSSTQPR